MVQFALHSIDDVAEDTVKIVLLTTIWWFTRYLLANRGAGGWQIAAAVAVVAVAHPFVDAGADAVGDACAVWVDDLRATLRLPPLHRPPSNAHSAVPSTLDPQSGALVHAVDDVVEDAFKALCVLSHVRMGTLLQSSIVASNPGGAVSAAMLQAAGVIVAVGTPASRYSECNDYADALGDAAQQWLAESIT